MDGANPEGLGFRVLGFRLLGFRVVGFQGFRGYQGTREYVGLWGLSKEAGLGLRVWGLGHRVKGVAFRVHVGFVGNKGTYNKGTLYIYIYRDYSPLFPTSTNHQSAKVLQFLGNIGNIRWCMIPSIKNRNSESCVGICFSHRWVCGRWVHRFLSKVFRPPEI